MKSKYFLFSLLLTFSFIAQILSAYDLRKTNQNFILEEKKIEIPGYPTAYNASIVPWNEKYLMSFKVKNPKIRYISKIAIVILDENFTPISTPQIVDTRVNLPKVPSKSEDARLVNINNHVYVIYNDNLQAVQTFGTYRHIFVAELDYTNGKFSLKNTLALDRFPGAKTAQPKQKNWSPFDYKGELYLIYSISPERIFKPDLSFGKCAEVAHNDPFSVKSPKGWKWGVFRGGTPAILVDGQYISFFHTRQYVKDNSDIEYWLMGAYTFDSEPPFNMRKASPEPIITGDFWTWQNKFILYPMGIFADDNYIWISYGKNNNEIWIAKMDKQKLLDSLVPVIQNKP